MSKILFVFNALQPFVNIDLILLKERWRVTELFEKSPKQLNPIKILWLVLRSDIVYCWFASWHSFFPVIFAKMLNKPSIIVVGGYDTANLPEVRYGSQRGGIRRLIARTILSNATYILPFSQSACEEVSLNIVPSKNKVKLIYLGVEPVTSVSSDERSDVVLTVGGVWRENLQRKGLLPFVRAATFLPQLEFILVGKWYDESITELRQIAGPNVFFAGFLLEDELRNLYRKASVYVQASLHEGFGMSVAEAMSAGCIPVVTKVGSLPEVVGDAGIYSVSNSPIDIAAAIKEALTLGSEAREKASQRIADNFTIEARRTALHFFLDGLNTKVTK